MDTKIIMYMQYASDKVKAAGFRLYATSMKSEACYYNFPPSKKLLRIAAHRKSKTDGFGKKVVGYITFAAKCPPKSMDKVDQIICLAVGQYFLAKEPL